MNDSRARRGQRRLAAIMFTDMVGYSALVGRDEARALRLLDEQRRIVRGCLSRFGGREVETAGDAFLVEFESALMAMLCSIALQKAMAGRAASVAAEDGIALRIALHLGDIEHPGRQVFGDPVNIAARLQELAPHGGIALSAQVYHQVQNKVAAGYRFVGAASLKNIEQPVEVYVLDAAAIAAAPAPPVVPLAPAGAARRPHGLLLISLFQGLAGLTNLFWGLGLVVTSLDFHVSSELEAGVRIVYLGVGATLLGVGMLGASYGLLRLRSWGRTGSLALNFLNVPLALAILVTFFRVFIQHDHRGGFPVLLQVAGPTLSVIVLAYLLSPGIRRYFDGD